MMMIIHLSSQYDVEYSTCTTQLVAYKTNNRRTINQVHAQQPIMHVVNWDNFYLFLMCSNTAYQCDNLNFKNLEYHNKVGKI